jgi:hypothetical protein
MSAILDAGKVGHSLKDAILYTKTFPCHLCARDILNSGIKMVVFIEAYPKSKVKDLYPKLIEIDPLPDSTKLAGFYTFTGVGPKKYAYFYALDNRTDLAPKNADTEVNCFMKPKRLCFRTPIFYIKVEKSLINYLDVNQREKNEEIEWEKLGVKKR